MPDNSRKAVMVQTDTMGRFDEWRKRLGLPHDAAINYLLNNQDTEGIYREIDHASRQFERAIRDHFHPTFADSVAIIKAIAINLREALPVEQGQLSEDIVDRLRTCLDECVQAKKRAENLALVKRLEEYGVGGIDE